MLHMSNYWSVGGNVNFQFLIMQERFFNRVQVIFFLFIEFIGVTLVNKITQVSGAQFYNTSPVHCIVCLPPQVKSRSITIYPPIPS